MSLGIELVPERTVRLALAVLVRRNYLAVSAHAVSVIQLALQGSTACSSESAGSVYQLPRYRRQRGHDREFRSRSRPVPSNVPRHDGCVPSGKTRQIERQRNRD